MKNEANVESRVTRRTALESQVLRIDPVRSPESHAGTVEPKEEECLERVVLQLNTLCKTATLDFALSVGQVVIANLYCGDLDRWRSRHPNKDHSLRKLVKHPNLPMSPHALYRSIAIFEVCERLGIRSWKHVSTSHVRLVLPLPLAEQARLLEATEANRWSARRLDDEVAALIRRDPSFRQNRGGRKRASPLRERMRSLQKVIAALNEVLAPNDETGAEPSPASARAVIDLLLQAAHRCAALKNRLESRLINATTDPPPALVNAGEV